jgi:hypothetical protein
MQKPRLFSSSLSLGQRLGYGLATAWFVLVAAALVWPVYSWFSGIRPRILGLPLSLAFLVGLTLFSFAVGLVLYVWEDRQGVFDSREANEQPGPDEGAE